jgi:hypothetical protein
MKKFLTILVLSLLLSGNAFAGLFSKDKIKAKECYDDGYKNYKEQKKWEIANGITKWEWELNLKDNMAILIVVQNGKLSLDRLPIIIKTDDYIIAKNNGNGSKFVGGSYGGDFQFDLENEAVITELSGTTKVTHICNFN